LANLPCVKSSDDASGRKSPSTTGMKIGCKQGPQWGPVDFKAPFMGAHGPSPGPLLF
jgi:hypothetical protein